jgi:nicotinamide mononucleotide transporter
MLEWFGVLTGLIYLYLEIRQHRIMWVVGFITSLVYVWVFFASKVYANMGLQLYYALISVYGFWLWRQSRSNASTALTILYRRLTWRTAVLIGLSSALIFAGIYFVLSRYTDSAVPVGDAFTTTIGIVATWMLARRIIEHWYFWIVADSVSIYIYYYLGLYPTMFLYLCYAVLAYVGYYNWKKKGEERNADGI